MYDPQTYVFTLAEGVEFHDGTLFDAEVAKWNFERMLSPEPKLIVPASPSTAGAILAEASLSFLGLGVQPPAPSWGSMLDRGRDYLDLAGWIAIAPGATIFLTVLGFNFLGDALRDALDPRLAA